MAVLMVLFPHKAEDGQFYVQGSHIEVPDSDVRRLLVAKDGVTYYAQLPETFVVTKADMEAPKVEPKAAPVVEEEATPVLEDSKPAAKVTSKKANK